MQYLDWTKQAKLFTKMMDGTTLASQRENSLVSKGKSLQSLLWAMV